MLIRDPSLRFQAQNADSSLGDIDIRMLAYPRKIFYFRHLLSKGASQPMPFHSIPSDSPGFLEALVLARDFECTDPKDRIFALWNLARDKSGLQFAPDYQIPYESVYTSFARAWIQQKRSLDIIGAVERVPDNADFYSNAPSWCPNWNCAAVSSCLIRKDYLPARFMAALGSQDGKLYSADGGVAKEYHENAVCSFEADVLHCKGLLIDSIKLIFDDAPDIPSGTAPKSTWRFHYWMDSVDKFCRQHGLPVYEEPLRAACAMFHGDSVDAWPGTNESSSALRTLPANERYVCSPEASRHILRYADSYDRSEAWSVVDAILRGRRPFISENGYMGLAPSFIIGEHPNGTRWYNEDLHLAVIAGCSVPLILRGRDDGSYQIVGTCFVQGWMEGEWIQTLMGANDAREFWEALREGDQLSIR